jgi:hypothetical protein
MKFLFLLFTLLGVGNALASDLDFTLINKTHRSFEAIYITSTDNKDWDGNLLPNGQALAAGKKLQVNFDPTAGSATWDLNIVDNEGLVVTFSALKLSHVDTITLKTVKGVTTAVVE